MSPRLDPRLYVIRLAWLSRRAARRGTSTLCACSRPVAGRACLFGDRRAARTRWPRPSLWRDRI
jgi:hypothetical protein